MVKAVEYPAKIYGPAGPIESINKTPESEEELIGAIIALAKSSSDPEWAALSKNPNAKSRKPDVEKILGKEIMSNPVQNTRIKQPENKLNKESIHDGLSGRTPWHQDAAVLNTRGQKLTDIVTVWIPFTKTTKKNGCMITVKEINKMGLLNHVPGYRGQVELKNSKLLDKMKHVPLEADVGDIILLHKHSIHCSLPNRSNDFRISADLRYNVAGQPSGREPLPNFYVRSKNKNNIKIQNFKQWLTLWEKAKEKCIPRKYAFKYPLPTFKNNKRDLSNLINS